MSDKLLTHLKTIFEDLNIIYEEGLKSKIDLLSLKPVITKIAILYDLVVQNQCEDTIVQRVVDKFKSRSQEGIKKYGTTLADNNLSREEWLNHLQEELMDAVVYLERLKQEL